MADNEEGEGITTRGNEWEVVSLTASAYAAAPGPEYVETKDSQRRNVYGEDEAETSSALFMSRHFVFPPSEHENLPLEPDNSGVYNESVGKDVVSELGVEEGDRSSTKDGENWTLRGLNVADEYPGMQFFNEKGNSMQGAEFEEGMTLPGLDLTDKEQSLYSATAFSSFHSETALGGSATYAENTAIPEVTDHSDRDLNFPAEVSMSSEVSKADKFDGAKLPCEAWWKRRAASLYAHAKEANAFWSIFIAAAVMGLVILGQQWQQERWKALQLKWQCNINDQKTSRMMGPITRLKDVIVGGNPRRGPFIRGSTSE